MNEELKRTEFDRAFCKKFKLLDQRFSSFSRQKQKIGRENDPSKKNRRHRTSKTVQNTGKAIVMAIGPIAIT